MKISVSEMLFLRCLCRCHVKVLRKQWMLVADAEGPPRSFQKLQSVIPFAAGSCHLPALSSVCSAEQKVPSQGHNCFPGRPAAVTGQREL